MVSNRIQNVFAFVDVHPRPGPVIERPPRRLNRDVDLVSIGLTQLTDDGLSRRIHDWKVFAAHGRSDRLAIDEAGDVRVNRGAWRRQRIVHVGAFQQAATYQGSEPAAWGRCPTCVQSAGMPAASMSAARSAFAYTSQNGSLL